MKMTYDLLVDFLVDFGSIFLNMESYVGSKSVQSQPKVNPKLAHSGRREFDAPPLHTQTHTHTHPALSSLKHSLAHSLTHTHTHDLCFLEKFPHTRTHNHHCHM